MTETRPRRSVQSLAAILDGRLQAFPAEYRGVAMRSQLEADFAHHLDAIGVTWEYEPRVYRGDRDPGYLPDFRIAGDPIRYIEVKPTKAEVRHAAHRMEVIWETEPDALLVVACGEGCTFYSAERGKPWHSFAERWRHG